MTEHEDHFTVFIRLPFVRGDFVDPPPVAWSAAKERELWEIISKSSKGHEIDWRSLSEHFNVTQAFLLQQAAWLYERQLSQVRAQMRKMGTKSSNTPSPIPQSNTASLVGDQPMRRTGSGGSRAPSRLSTQMVTAESGSAGIPGTPAKGRSSFPGRTIPPITATNTKTEPTSSRPLSRKASKESEVVSRTHSRRGSVQHQSTRSPKQVNLPDPESSSGGEEMMQSRMLHRRPSPVASRRLVPTRKSQHTRRPSAPQLEEEEDEDSPAFLPFSNNSSETAKADSSIARDPSATIRGGIAQTQRPAARRRSTSERVVPASRSSRSEPLSNLTSSASSTSEHHTGNRTQRPASSHNQTGRGNLPTPLSPHQQAALAAAAGLSPRLRRAAGNGSDTSPSMGSSFSDLDDASVTQSALEEALLSGMGNTTMTIGGGTVGNVAHRVSGISQALRSRYFDGIADNA